MAINFQSALGIHEAALHVRAKRAEVLANNLINSDTPNFKARDIDFKSALSNSMQAAGTGKGLTATHGRHIGGNNANGLVDANLMYRNPMQPSLDGNTVEEQSELSRFAQNSMDFQASFQLLNSKFKGLSRAIKGEV